MLASVFSIFFLFFFTVSSAFFFAGAFLIWMVTVMFDRRLIFLHLYSSVWASLYLWIMPNWSVSVEGRQRIRKGGTFLVVSNHRSLLDILVAYRLFFHFKWVSKAEVFRLPFIGWNMLLNNYIPIKRGDGESVARMMKKCEKKLLDGSSVYFFPEGTRSKSSMLKKFKPGAFILAKKLKLPVLPIAISGTANALPKHSLKIRGRHMIRIKVLEEISYEQFSHLSAKETAAMVRKKISENI